MIRGALLLAAALVAIAAPAPADADRVKALTPGVVGPDDRRIVTDAAAFRAVGRLNHGGGFCTATLIAPDRVLTAAHCLFYPRTGRPIPPERLQFLAGYRQGRYAGRAVGARRVLHWNFVPPGPRFMAEMAADVAIVVLAEALPGVTPLPVAPLPPGARLTSVSYARDRAELPSVERGCRAEGRRGALLFTNCDVNFGGSGGPLLIETQSGPRVVAIVSGAVRRNGQGGTRVRSIAVTPPRDLVDAP